MAPDPPTGTRRRHGGGNGQAADRRHDIQAGVFDVYIDNEAKASGVPFITKAATLDKLTFQSWGSTAGTDYVDDVGVAREETETKK